MNTKIKTLFSNFQQFCNLFPSTASNGAMEGRNQLSRINNQQIPFGFFTFFLLLTMFLLNGCTFNGRGESEILRNLRATERVYDRSKIVKSSYFFYPSTMRMVNIDDLPNWNEVINDVRRLGILTMWPDHFDDEKQKEVVEDLKEKENFSMYAEMEDQHLNFKLLGRKRGREAILIYNDSTVNYVIHLLGKINYVKLMKLSGDLRDMESPGAGIELLKNTMERDGAWATRSKNRQIRNEKRKAAEQLKKDSIEAAQPLETAITE